ncbi:MAG: SMI1/KNR4 family protein [Marinoscillum sp.]
MTNLEIIEKLRESIFVDEDGEQYQLEFQPSLSEQEIELLKKAFPRNTIAPELIEILKVTKGWDGYGPEMVYFDSIGEFGFTELSSDCITLGHDGFGNFWILDINSDGTLGKVFFACHDPAVFVIHSQSLNEYLYHLLEFYQKPDQAHLNEIHDKTVMTIWKENLLCSTKRDFIISNPEYSKYFERFETDDWTVADLRSGNNKDGFAWGKFDSNQYTARHPNDLIWVIQNKKKGFLARIFGK